MPEQIHLAYINQTNQHQNMLVSWTVMSDYTRQEQGYLEFAFDYIVYYLSHNYVFYMTYLLFSLWITYVFYTACEKNARLTYSDIPYQGDYYPYYNTEESRCQRERQRQRQKDRGMVATSHVKSIICCPANCLCSAIVCPVRSLSRWCCCYAVFISFVLPCILPLLFPAAMYEFYEMERYGEANVSYVQYCSVDPYQSKDNIFTSKNDDSCKIKSVKQSEFNTKHIKRKMFTTQLNNLAVNTRYKYTVGSARTGWSDWLEFNTFKPEQGKTLPVTFAIYGDYGVVNHQIQGELTKILSNHPYDMVIHMGDMAYDLSSDDGARGDIFMNQIQPFAGRVPYMTCPGNHEVTNNFTHYTNRYVMPYEQSGGTPLYYSFDVGDIHIVSISTELYHYSEYYTQANIDWQLRWLANDIKASTARWKIVFGHRPMYCTHDMHDYPGICDREPLVLRNSIESLLKDNHVDFYLAGHLHNYERLWPVYNNRTVQKNYVNSQGPVNIISGAAGCQEEKDIFEKENNDWSAYRSNRYGFGIMTVYNNTHIYWKQVLAKNGHIDDEAWIVKDESI